MLPPKNPVNGRLSPERELHLTLICDIGVCVIAAAAVASDAMRGGLATVRHECNAKILQ